MTPEQADKFLKEKLHDLKEQKRHEEIVGTIALMGETLTDDIVKAIKEIKIDAPEIPEIQIPKIETPIIPEIKLPDFPEIKIPEIQTDGIEEAIAKGFMSVEIPQPQITVTPTTVNLPEPKVTVNVPQPKVTVNVPEQISDAVIPKYDSGTVKHRINAVDGTFSDVWTFTLKGKKVAVVTLIYSDKEREELASFKIDAK